MAVITFANAKGGAGKTTAALILSTELARQGHRVVVLDADPQRWITSWAENSGQIANLSVISHITPASLECHIREMKDEADYIIIDLAGAKDQIVALALALSDQVLIPVQGCAMDARGAVQILELIRQIEDRSRVRINHSVVLDPGQFSGDDAGAADHQDFACFARRLRARHADRRARCLSRDFRLRRHASVDG